MKILLVCMKYDYGDPNRGRSYEYYNFYKSLKVIGHEVILFDFLAEFKRLGKTEMNKRLLAVVESSKPVSYTHLTLPTK
jgi:spore maturation protein CgeB